MSGLLLRCSNGHMDCRPHASNSEELAVAQRHEGKPLAKLPGCTFGGVRSSVRTERTHEVRTILHAKDHGDPNFEGTVNVMYVRDLLGCAAQVCEHIGSGSILRATARLCSYILTRVVIFPV